MSLKITRKIGKTTYTLDVDPSNLVKSINGATWLKDAPEKCSECNSRDLDLSARITVAKQGQNAGQTFEYLEMRCLNFDCRAKATAGKFKDGSGYFWKDYGKMEKWQGNSAPQNGQNNPSTDGVEDDVPF